MAGEIWVMLSGKVKAEFDGTSWDRQFRELDSRKLQEEPYRSVLEQHGVYRFEAD